MPRFFKRGKVVTQSLRTKKLCIHCGHDEFKITEDKFSWLLGQKFVCAKCGGTFRKANLVRVYEKSRQFYIQKISSFRKAKRKRRK